MRGIYQHAYRVFAAGTPLVAAVQGAAVGGGLGLALSADFRGAADSAAPRQLRSAAARGSPGVSALVCSERSLMGN